MSLGDELNQQLQGEPLAQISRQLGVPQAQVANAAPVASPLLRGRKR